MEEFPVVMFRALSIDSFLFGAFFFGIWVAGPGCEEVHENWDDRAGCD